MGVLLYWEKPNSESGWDYADIYRSTSEDGTYSLVVSQAITDNSYYDQEGTSSSWYKIRFRDTGGTESDFSDGLQGQTAYLYSNPNLVLDAAGLNINDLPSVLTTDKITQFIWDVSRNIDEMRETVYGRQETLINQLYHSRFLDLKRLLRLKKKEIDSSASFTVERKLGDGTWQTLQEQYDYDVDYKKGKVKFYFDFTYEFKSYNDIRVNGTYGLTTVPDVVKKLTKLYAAIKCIVFITGGSFDDVTSYSMGSVSYSLGEPYTNLNATIKMLESEIETLIGQNGWQEKKGRVRMA